MKKFFCSFEFFTLCIVLFFVLVGFILGCTTLGMQSKYSWKTTPIDKEQYKYTIERIKDWREAGIMLGSGECFEWADKEYRRLQKEGKGPFIIAGYTEWWVEDITYLGSNGETSYYRTRKSANTNLYPLHVLVGYYNSQGVLVVSDGDIDTPGLCTGAGGYWDCKKVADFIPKFMFNHKEIYGFTS